MYLLLVFYYNPLSKRVAFRDEIYNRGYRRVSAVDRLLKGSRKAYAAWRELFVSRCISVTEGEFKRLGSDLRERSASSASRDMRAVEKSYGEIFGEIRVLPGPESSFSLPFGGAVQDDFAAKALRYCRPDVESVVRESRLMLSRCILEGVGRMRLSHRSGWWGRFFLCPGSSFGESVKEALIRGGLRVSGPTPGSVLEQVGSERETLILAFWLRRELLRGGFSGWAPIIFARVLLQKKLKNSVRYLTDPLRRLSSANLHLGFTAGDAVRAYKVILEEELGLRAPLEPLESPKSDREPGYDTVCRATEYLWSYVTLFGMRTTDLG
jgi:hypothetical protein